LLCSDGLYSVVPDTRLAEILGRDEPFQTVCDTLIAEANAAGGPDNITALVLQVDAD
jgi:protein phosphatase